MLCSLLLSAIQTELTGGAAELYSQALTGRHAAEIAKLKPTIKAATNGKTFSVIWKPISKPEKWIVTIHGSRGYATEDLAIWHRNLGDHKFGVVAVQWWLGKGQSDYLTPKEVYKEIDVTLKSLGVGPQTCIFQGFSRGASNSYAIVAEDVGAGRYFRLAVASSGEANLNYPPTRSIVHGGLRGTNWITVAGRNDPRPDRDGIEGMRRTAAWLKEQGADVILQIEDEAGGHGALQTNPANAKKVLDLFLDQR
ncbi:MAG: hypothetical protein ABL962_12275 [Fimbriimonadaceae bacterium]